MNVICSVALALLMDISGSLGVADWEAQVEGHARAFESAAIGQVIDSTGPIAVRADAFSDGHRTILTWRLLTTSEDAQQFAADFRQHSLNFPGGGGTMTAAALEASGATFASVPCEAERQVIDLVTDGYPYDGVRMPQVRQALIDVDIQLNAIFVQTEDGYRQSIARGYTDGFDWLSQEVITPGGLVFSLEGWQDFERTIRRKLIWELANVSPIFLAP